MFNNPNNEELSQQEKILVIMFRNQNEQGVVTSKWWRASDFQRPVYDIFVGYEASARMSELIKDYPFAFEIRRNGRFREVRFLFEQASTIYNKFPHDLARHLVREKIII